LLVQPKRDANFSSVIFTAVRKDASVN